MPPPPPTTPRWPLPHSHAATPCAGDGGGVAGVAPVASAESADRSSVPIAGRNRGRCRRAGGVEAAARPLPLRAVAGALHSRVGRLPRRRRAAARQRRGRAQCQVRQRLQRYLPPAAHHAALASCVHPPPRKAAESELQLEAAFFKWIASAFDALRVGGERAPSPGPRAGAPPSPGRLRPTEAAGLLYAPASGPHDVPLGVALPQEKRSAVLARCAELEQELATVFGESGPQTAPCSCAPEAEARAAAPVQRSAAASLFASLLDPARFEVVGGSSGGGGGDKVS